MDPHLETIPSFSTSSTSTRARGGAESRVSCLFSSWQSVHSSGGSPHYCCGVGGTWPTAGPRVIFGWASSPATPHSRQRRSAVASSSLEGVRLVARVRLAPVAGIATKRVIVSKVVLSFGLESTVWSHCSQKASVHQYTWSPATCESKFIVHFRAQGIKNL